MKTWNELKILTISREDENVFIDALHFRGNDMNDELYQDKE